MIAQPKDIDHAVPALDLTPTGKVPAVLNGLPAQPIPPAGLTAEQRGAEWMARYGCTPWCVLDHAGTDGEPGWHQGPRAAVTAPTPYADSMPGDGLGLVLAARVTTVNQDAAAFGVESLLWVEIDCETLELDVEQTDVLISRLEQFLPVLRALRGQLAEASGGDFPADPVAKARYMAEMDERVKTRTAELLAAEASK
ncbi:DUF6907 domain-containing protein [Streptomyces sp. NPDC002730]|uniref:DUF6907 domain-containing protein n=1 Tax=Streptomyces sp. NPDC002730 TaxID=3364662 RepID=UPI0036813B8B